jgi:hypothetical protein
LGIFDAIWCIFPFWYFVPIKIWQPFLGRVRVLRHGPRRHRDHQAARAPSPALRRKPERGGNPGTNANNCKKNFAEKFNEKFGKKIGQKLSVFPLNMQTMDIELVFKTPIFPAENSNHM